MENDLSKATFNCIKNDPEALLLLIDKFVRVKATKNCSFTGFIHSIDPVSHSIFLLVPKEDSYQIVLIPGYSIIEVTELEPNTNNIIHRKGILDSNAEIERSNNTGERKKKVVNWLKSNLLPVTEDGENIIVGDASLLPPYTTVDICTSNPMVAMQMRKILDNMPQDS